MNDKEAIVNVFELCLLDAAERTGYISVYSGEEPNDA